MSLVATYVESQEGSWWENPEVSGDGWFICWDDDEPIEIVVDAAKGIEASNILRFLSADGWKLRIIGKSSIGAQRMFSGQFRPAISYFLTQENKGPKDSMLKGKKLPARPRGQGVYYLNSKNGNEGQA